MLPHTAYSMAKYAMSLVVLGLAGETRGRIGVNALWPRTTIATAAIRNILGGEALMRRSRRPEIIADAAYRVFAKPVTFTGNFLIDDTFLASEGVADFEPYRADPSVPFAPDFFVPDDSAPLRASSPGIASSDGDPSRQPHSSMRHETPRGHPERVERILAVRSALADPAFDALFREDAPAALRAEIERCHPAAYVARSNG